MTSEDRALVKNAIERKLAILKGVAELRDNRGERDNAAGIRKAIEYMRRELIGDGKGCVITLCDPRHDDPAWSDWLS